MHDRYRQRHGLTARATRPQVVLSGHDQKQAGQSAEIRAREATAVRIDEFIRVEIPSRLRRHPGIHNVGHIEGDGGRVLTLIRCDRASGDAADPRIEQPSIGLMRMANELTIGMVAELNLPAAGALALVLRGGRPQTSDQNGVDDAPLNISPGSS